MSLAHVSKLGGGRFEFEQTAAGLSVQLPTGPPCKEALVLKIKGDVV
jgi:hypothetical protein